MKPPKTTSAGLLNNRNTFSLVKVKPTKGFPKLKKPATTPKKRTMQ